MSRWRMLPTPRLWIIPRAAEASAYMYPFPGRVRPKSFIMDENPNTSAVVRTTPPSSASADDKAIPAWVLLQDRTKCFPWQMPPALVDFRVLMHPAQFVSEYATNSVGLFCHLYLYTNLGFPLRYLAMRLMLAQSAQVGADIHRHTSFAAN